MAEKGRAEKYITYGMSLLIVTALIVRLFFTISPYDEVLNIRTSYLTAVMGQRHLVENAFSFTMGDVFNLPFVFLFYKLTGGMAGIVLFMRFVFLGFNLILAGVLFLVLSPYMGKRNSALFALILISYAPFSVYSVWYDSSALFFMLTGALLYAGSILCKEKKGRWMRYLSGVCHGCMVYAYPLMVLVVLAILIGGTIRIVRRREKVRDMVPYLGGGLTIIMVFCIYCTCVGWSNICLFQEGYIQGIMDGRVEMTSAVEVVDGAAWDVAALDGAAGAADTLHPLIIKLKQIVKRSLGQQEGTILITAFLLIQWAVGLRKQGMIRVFLLIEIIVTAFFCNTNSGQWATMTAYAYYACWAPFLFCYLRDQARKVGKVLLCCLWVTSWIAYLAVGFTALYCEKAEMGLYAGAVCTLIYMVFITAQNSVGKRELTAWIIFLAAIVNVALVYLNVYEDDRISKCSYRMKDGIFKGIYTVPENEVYENAERKVRELAMPDGTMVCLPYEEARYYPVLLWGEFVQGGTDFQTAERELTEGIDVETMLEKQDWADLMVTTQEIYEESPQTRVQITDRYYQLVISEGDILFFRRNTNMK